MYGAEIFNQYNIFSNYSSSHDYQDKVKIKDILLKHKKHLKINKESLFSDNSTKRALSTLVDDYYYGKEYRIMKDLIFKAIIPNPDNNSKCFELTLKLINVKAIDI